MSLSAVPAAVPSNPKSLICNVRASKACSEFESKSPMYVSCFSALFIDERLPVNVIDVSSSPSPAIKRRPFPRLDNESRPLTTLMVI